MTWTEWALDRMRRALLCDHSKGRKCIPAETDKDCKGCYAKDMGIENAAN
jgi:hypothetical protein